MTDRQQLRRLSVVNGLTACLLMIWLATESKFVPAGCLLLLTYSFVGSVHYLTKDAALSQPLGSQENSHGR